MASAPDIPNWGLYMMCTASVIGAILLARQLAAKGWPSPLSA